MSGVSRCNIACKLQNYFHYLIKFGFYIIFLLDESSTLTILKYLLTLQISLYIYIFDVLGQGSYDVLIVLSSSGTSGRDTIYYSGSSLIQDL